MLADGTWTVGSGAATRDCTFARVAAGLWCLRASVLIGSGTPLGDNGVGEIQLADATTVPTVNPAGGVDIYSQSSAVAAPIKIRTPAGDVKGLAPGWVYTGAAQNSTVTAQTASTALTLAVEANASYEMEAMIVMQSPSGVSFTNSFTGPAGASMIWCDTTATYMGTLGAVDSWTGTGANKVGVLKGALIVGATAGALTVTFGSGTAGQTAILGAGSWLKLTRVH
jgi:hypothetical protein